jgi:hypothetical protein
MSSEYIYGRKAVNIRGLAATYTALFIESHSSNTFPHEPRWSFYAISKQENALNYVLRHVHHCEGGMTRGPKGVAISAPHEIGCWREAIASAGTMHPGTQLNLEFCKNHYYGSQLPLESLAPFKQLASELELPMAFTPLRKMDELGASVEIGEAVTLNLSHPGVADLVWRAMQEIKVKDLLYGGEPRLVSGYVFMRPLTDACHPWLKPLPVDREVRVVPLVKSDWVMQETITKFKFPYENDPGFSFEKFVVSDWQGRVVSTDPERWFCTKLIELEAAHPGTAESAYRRFKKIIKALVVTPHQGVTIEVMAAMPTAENEVWPQWVIDGRAKLFAASAQYKEGFAALYTGDVTSHLGALALSDFLECNIALPEKAEKPIEQLCLIGE